MRHQITGTLHPASAADAEDAAHDAAYAYFGDRPYTIQVATREVRDIGDSLLHYATDYTAVLIEDGEP